MNWRIPVALPYVEIRPQRRNFRLDGIVFAGVDVNPFKYGEQIHENVGISDIRDRSEVYIHALNTNIPYSVSAGDTSD